ncbi:MAG: DUF2971 domain-containing protein [Bacteroidetes bacterium]|nr:DUF2971 domain-containing protein [Bacteroidota bacterium]
METTSLYHYCKLATAIEYILPAKRLLLNQLGKTNDPRENKDFVFAGLNISANEPFNLNEQNALITRELRRDCKLLCLCKDHSPFFGYELSRMWALYGDNHKGICIEFDIELFKKENASKIDVANFREIKYYRLDVTQPIVHREVDYERVTRVGLAKYVREDFRPNNLEYLFFTKNKEWESEQEVRLLYFSDATENEYCSIAKSIRSIYLGVDFNHQYLPAIKATCQSIPIYQLDYRDVRLVVAKKV